MINPKPRGFAAMTPERQREIASMGGKAAGAKYSQEHMRVLGRNGGRKSGGNFARNPQRAVECGRKGGAVVRKYYEEWAEK